MSGGNNWGRHALITGLPFGVVMGLSFWTRDHGWSDMLSVKFLVVMIWSLLIGYLFGGTFRSVWGRIRGG